MTKKGFVLLPDKQTERKLIHMNNTLFPDIIRLDAEQTLPHVTVVQTYFKTGFNPAPFLEQFKNSPTLASEPKVTVDRYIEDDGYVLAEFREAAWLNTLNKVIIDAVKDWIDVEQSEPTTYKNDAEKVSWEVTGYKRNLDAYSPHFTLGVTAGTPVNIPSLQEAGVNRVAFRRLVFCEHEDNGAIKNVISSIHLPFTWN